MNQLHILHCLLGALLTALLACMPSHAQTEKTDSIATDSLRLLLLAPDSAATPAQKLSITKKLKQSWLARFIRSFDEYDTAYITPNYYNFTAMAQNTNIFQLYKLSGRAADGHRQSISTKPEANVKVGPYFGWRWIFVGYTFDISHPAKAGSATELSLSLYSSQLGCDFVHVRNNGNYRLRRATGFGEIPPNTVKNEPFDGINAKTTSFDAYYVFNHRRFSYPAVYNQSTVQRRSQGSGMLGLGFSKQSVDFDYTRLPDYLQPLLIDELKFSGFNYTYYYISGGYAYNWVFLPKWTLGVSLMPSVGWRQVKGEKRAGIEDVFLNMKNFSFDGLFRMGLVWNNSRIFAGASLISHLYLYKKQRLTVTNSINYLNIYAGFYFQRKRQYRNRKL
ncbi:MAG: DUF4421 domain-containing protein [Alloprevotella sp.]